MNDLFRGQRPCLRKRPGILNLGVDSFEDQHIEAARIIRRDLGLWYQAEARIRDIDSEIYPMYETRFSDVDIEIKPAAVLLAMSLVYDLLAKDAASEEDSMAAQREHYRREFEREWEAARRAGFSYDWDASGEVETDEKGAFATALADFGQAVIEDHNVNRS